MPPDGTARVMPLTALDPSEYRPDTRIIEGPGCLAQTGELARSVGMSKALLVTDPGVALAGHAARVEESLTRAGVAWSRFDNVHENPTTDDIAACLVCAIKAGVDGLIAVGGGSVIDTAKACNMRLANGQAELGASFADDLAQRLLPFLALPTTAGTGSEVQSYAIIAQPRGHQKRAYGHASAAPTTAILDAQCAMTVPGRIAACCGLDAVTHALESAVCTKATEHSRSFALESFRLLSRNLPQVLSARANEECWAAMLRAACLAGLSIENSMLGAAHSMANPLTARLSIPHGHAVAMMMPHVIRWNAKDSAAAQVYQELTTVGGLGNTGAPALIEFLRGMMELAQLPMGMAEIGIESEAIKAMAGEAAQQWTAGFNPRPVTTTDFALLYESAMTGEA